MRKALIVAWNDVYKKSKMLITGVQYRVLLFVVLFIVQYSTENEVK